MDRRKVRTYLDSCVLIAAVQGDNVAHAEALEILNDPFREYVTSDFVRLETIPKAEWENRKHELEFFDEFFSGATRFPTNEEYGKIAKKAVDIACTDHLKSMDALHISSAINLEAEEVITADKEWGRARGIRVVVMNSVREEQAQQ